MPAVVTAAGSLVCPHKAPIVIRPGQHKFTVDGQPVLVEDDLHGASVPTCPNSGGGNTKCNSIKTVTKGLATRLDVDGVAVVLATATGLTDSNPPGAWTVKDAGQTKLVAA
jgi:hypothetical protein